MRGFADLGPTGESVVVNLWPMAAICEKGLGSLVSGIGEVLEASVTEGRGSTENIFLAASGSLLGDWLESQWRVTIANVDDSEKDRRGNIWAELPLLRVKPIRAVAPRLRFLIQEVVGNLVHADEKTAYNWHLTPPPRFHAWHTSATEPIAFMECIV